MDFKLEASYNPYLSLGTNRIDAIITVTTSGEIVASASGLKAVAFIIDTSGSMDNNGKIIAAKNAVCRCIQQLDSSTKFTVIKFSGEAGILVPLTLASVTAKNKACDIVGNIAARGGTVMSSGLRAARQIFKEMPQSAICYAMFLTDGFNEGEHRNALIKEINNCRGMFQCDSRGFGTDWDPSDLRLISGELLGNADAVSEISKLENDFKEALGKMLSKGIADVKLRLWTPKTSKITLIKQMNPEILDLTKHGITLDEKNLDVPLGAWGAESRDYHVSLQLTAGDNDEEMMVCRPGVILIEDGVETKITGQPIIARWTRDEDLSTRISPEVAHYTGQAELANAIKEGLEAKQRGDVDGATRLLGRAAKIADETGNDEVTTRLKKVVDILDVNEGTVRLKSGSNKGADLELDMGGTRTVRRRPAA